MRTDIIEIMANLIEQEFDYHTEEIQTYDDFVEWAEEIRNDITTSDNYHIFSNEETRDTLAELIDEYCLDTATICRLIRDETTASVYVCDYLFNDATWTAWLRVEPEIENDEESED